ncbi:MAG: hypothetical protein RL213_310 [Bacteroidota bacterium]|jgi:hypothetical protein
MNSPAFPVFRVFAVVFLLVFSFLRVHAGTGDTTVVRTLRYDTTMRAGYFVFPDDTVKTYEKIIMVYGMRCKGGLVSTTSNRNLGCGEWDYNCYTSVIDSSQTDSLAASRDKYTISGSTAQTYYFTSDPVFDLVDEEQVAVTYDSVISETAVQPSAGNAAVEHTLGGSTRVHRAMYLWRAAELSTAGLTAGDITGLRLEVLTAANDLQHLSVRMKHTADTLLQEALPPVAGFTEVYLLNTPLAAPGTHQLNFSAPFAWDGVSNILMDFSYTLPSGSSADSVRGHDAGFPAGLYTDSLNGYLDVSASILHPDTLALSSVTDQVTVAFWAYGDTSRLPSNTSIAYGTDRSNARQLNIHLPWSDSKVYWDCGGSGGNYDRISQQVLPSDFEGRWTFWAFTKNASTGDMKIWMDGHLWSSGTGKTLPIRLTDYWIGASPNGFQYKGRLDEFSLWNKELDSSSIASVMYRSITPSHPDYQHLVQYYPFDEATGATAYDQGPNAATASFSYAYRQEQKGKELFRDFSATTFRPDVTFLQGDYVTSSQTFHLIDSVLRIPATVVEYDVVDNSLVTVDTQLVWPSGVYAYTYSAAGGILDSVLIQTTDSLVQQTLNYHAKRPMNFELIDFITPYGINLNLDGLNGKSWLFDVTDFAPVLRGGKYLSMNGAGRYSEENDIRFIFYEGTPPRDVRSVTQVWPNGGWTSASWSQIYNNVYFEPRDITLDPGASMFKIRSSISGHGQEGEFIPRNHTVSLAGIVDFTRSVWTECATNPIYPQGGTWIYDRAGWCPGKGVDLAEYELTPYVTPGQTVTFDYTMPFIANPGTSNYRVNNTLVTYGPPNFQRDASVHEIKSPSVRTEYLRFNPICDDPVVTIRSTGADTLTSLDIIYGREGGAQSSYHWTGALTFLQTEEVVLPAPAWIGSGIDRFRVSVANPNGAADGYAANDTMSTDFLIPDTYFGGIVLEYRPNNLVTQNSYTVSDAQGNVLLNRAPTVGGAIYRDTLNLPAGCYVLRMSDAGDDGLSFWANSNQGTGYFRIRAASTSTILKTFQPDFGDNIYYQFTVNYSLPVEGPSVVNPGITVFPNPSAGRFNTVIRGRRYSEVKLSVTDVAGRQVYAETARLTQSEQTVLIDLEGATPGIYFLVAEGEGLREVQRIAVQ